MRAGLSEREEKQLRALQRRKKRHEQSRFLAEGVRVVEDLLASPLQIEWLASSSSLEDSVRGAELIALIRERGLPLRVVPEMAFRKLAPTEHSQGVLAIARVPRPDWKAIDDVGTRVVLLLDAIQDPGNLGTIVRTSEALGVAAVVALPGTVDPWNPKSVRAAAGSLFRVPILQADWRDAADRLRRAAYRLLAAEAGGDPPQVEKGRIALVVGNEGSGISPDVRASVDGTIGILLPGRAESLNVGAAAAILLYELTR